MALKKPSDFFVKEELLNQITTIEKNESLYDELNRVEILSEQLNQLQQEITQKVIRTDLETLVLSEINRMRENFETLQYELQQSNETNIDEFRETIINLTEIVNNLVENEIPNHKKRITKNELLVKEKVNQFQQSVEQSINDIREEIGDKFNDIADVVDNNVDYFNQQLLETSSQVKKTTETYTNLYRIVESRISKENEQLDEYSKIIENIQTGFVELQESLNQKILSQQNTIEKKFENFELQNQETFNEYQKQFGSIQSDIESSIDNLVENYRKDLADVKSEVLINEKHIKNVDKYLQEYHQDLIELREEVFGEIENLPVGNLQENLERLERKIDYIKETYSKIEPEVIIKEVISKGTLNEPPETKNEDPLTPLNQNFVTLEQLQQHYRLFLNRIQQQLSTLGGGGETRLKYLDDIVGIATNPSAYDGKYLRYNNSIGKFEFSDVSSDDDSWVDNSYGTYTNANVGIGTSVPQYDLDVNGDINFNGSFYQNGSPFVASRWTSGTGDDIYRLSGNVGIGTTSAPSKLTVVGDVNITGVVTATEYYGSGKYLTDIISGVGVGKDTVIVGAGVSVLDFVGSGISTITVSSGIATINVPSTTRTISTYPATEGQTVFSASYNLGFVDVYLNGSRLSQSDYTATDGVTVVLNEGAALNDLVEIVGYTTYKVVGTQTILVDTVTSSSGIITSYTGIADQGSSQSANVWTIRRSIFTSAGITSSTSSATNVAWINKYIVSYI